MSFYRLHFNARVKNRTLLAKGRHHRKNRKKKLVRPLATVKKLQEICKVKKKKKKSNIGTHNIKIQTKTKINQKIKHNNQHNIEK